MAERKIHPLAAAFPALSRDELQALADDIKEHGLKEPVTLYEGQVLDGRNRLAACVLAGVKPHFVTFGGSYEEASSLVWSCNAMRRHLRADQRAAIWVQLQSIAGSHAARLKDELKASAQEKLSEAGRRGGKLAGRGRNRGVQISAQAYGEKTRVLESRLAGVSHTTLQRVRKLKPSERHRIIRGTARLSDFDGKDAPPEDDPCPSHLKTTIWAALKHVFDESKIETNSAKAQERLPAVAAPGLWVEGCKHLKDAGQILDATEGKKRRYGDTHRVACVCVETTSGLMALVPAVLLFRILKEWLED